MSKNIVFEGWLTKSPPTKRIWRTKWRRRWFALRQGELPGQYFLDYYADRNCRRHKGTINLDLCEQVDAGLHMERTGGVLDPKLRGCVFTIQTQSRVYHLEADCEADMEGWVDAICRVCGLRSTEDTSNVSEPNSVEMTAVYGSKSTGPYIPISECITGVRDQQDTRRSFTSAPRNIVNPRNALERVSERSPQIYLSQPQIRGNAEFSENESLASDEECKSLNASQSTIQNWSVARSFTKLKLYKQNGLIVDAPPEVPPRPPKTLPGNKLLEPPEPDAQTYGGGVVPRRASRCAPPARLQAFSMLRSPDDEEDTPVLPSMQYFNMSSLPPAVDRALKPRRTSHSLGPKSYKGNNREINEYDEVKAVALQYLDLDLQMSIPATSRSRQFSRKFEIVHGKTISAIEADSAYNTVDFLKTEAFNITRQDAEASRNNPN